jgi:hypothetical protein
MATQRDLVVDQGSRYRAVIKVTVAWLADLTGYNTVRGMVRASQTLDGDVLADLSAYLTVTDAVQGLVTLDIPADVTATWDWLKGHYDLEISNGTPALDVRFLQGEIRVDREVTR